MNFGFLYNFVDNWIQHPRGILSPQKSEQTHTRRKFVSVLTYYICAIRRLIWMRSMSAWIMPDWQTRPTTKIIALKITQAITVDMHSHTIKNIYADKYSHADTFKHIYSCRRVTTKSMVVLCLLVELSLSVMEVRRFRLITVLSTSQLLQPVSCQQQTEWGGCDSLEVHLPTPSFFTSN